MVNKIFDAFVKTLYKFVQLYWKLTKPITIGVRVIIINSDSQLLLVKHCTDGYWYLPGGMVNKGETLSQAIIRELKEEVQISIEPHQLNILGCYSSFVELKSDHIVLFSAKLNDVTYKKNIEISDCSFFAFNNFPIKTSLGTRRRIDELIRGELGNGNVW